MSTDALNTITIPILILGMILSYRGIPQLLIFCDAINDHRRFRRARVVTTWYHWIAVMTSSAQVFKGIEVGLTGDYSNMVGHLAFAMSLLPGVYYTFGQRDSGVVRSSCAFAVAHLANTSIETE